MCKLKHDFVFFCIHTSVYTPSIGDGALSDRLTSFVCTLTFSDDRHRICTRVWIGDLCGIGDPIVPFVLRPLFQSKTNSHTQVCKHRRSWTGDKGIFGETMLSTIDTRSTISTRAQILWRSSENVRVQTKEGLRSDNAPSTIEGLYTLVCVCVCVLALHNDRGLRHKREQREQKILDRRCEWKKPDLGRRFKRKAMGLGLS